MKKRLTLPVIFLFAFVTSAFGAIEIRGGTNFGTVIPNNDTTPRALDGTDFGDVVIPGSKTVSFQARAVGQQETIVSITEDGNAWSIASGGGFGAIAAGSSRTFTVKLEPTSAGYKSATISILTTSGLYQFLVQGNGIGNPTMIVRGQPGPGLNFINIVNGDSTPSAADGTSFGTWAVDAGSISRTFQLENTGTGQLVIDSISENSTEFSISGAPAVVGVNQTQTFSVRFNPTSFGTKTAVVTIRSNDATRDPFTFTVSGVGQASQIQVFGGNSQNVSIPNGDITPRILDNTDFGTVVAGSGPVTKVFQIRNTGNTNLIVTSVTENANAFSITGAPGILNPISPGGTANFNLILNATVAGPKSGTVTILSNDPDNGVFTFDIKAEATGNPQIVVRGRLNALTSFVNITNNDVTPSTIDGTDFGPQGVNDGFKENTFQIENTGNARLNITSISEGSPSFSVVNVPTSVAVGGTATFGVRFDPSSFGNKSATITIVSDDPEGSRNPFTFRVSGVGVFPVAQIYGGTGFAEPIAHNDSTPSTIDGTDFGSVPASNGSVTKTFRIRNEGNASLTVLGFSENGAAFNFSSTPAVPFSIAEGSSRDFSIKFEPTSAGSKSATVTVLTSDTVGGRNNYTFEIVGEATGVADLLVAGRQLANLPYQTIANGDTTPTAIDGTDFGNQNVGSGMVTRTFQISNTGSAQLVIDSITETSEHFSVGNVPSVVGVNQSQTFTVTFNPTSFGIKNTTIRIFTNAGNEESYTFRVRGQGDAAALLVEGGPNGGLGTIANGSVAPAVGEHNNFGELESHTTRTRTFRVSNIGNIAATIVSISENGAAWSLNGGSGPFSIPAGSSHNFTVTFEPISAGPKSATVTILSTQPSTPYFFEVTGIATGESDIRVLGRPNSALPFLPVVDGAATATTSNGTEFGDRSVSDGGLTHTFQIQNNGNAQLQISSISETSPHFSISGVPTVVGVNQTQQFTVTFNPTSLGVKTAVITIASNAPGALNPYTFTVRGIGEAPDIAIKGGTNFAQNIPNGSVTPSDDDGTDFGNVNVDSTVVTRTFRIENEGSEALTILAASSNSSEFTLGGVPNPISPIAPGDHRDFTISFDPAGTGYRHATILLQSNDPDENPFTFVVEGFGTDDLPALRVTGRNSMMITNGSLSPLVANGTDFGSVDINGPARRNTFSIENVGTGPLTITSISENGVRFSLAGSTSGTVLPGESLDFEVLYNPVVLATHNAIVTIQSNDPTAGTFTFGVTGVGVNVAPPATPRIVVTGGLNLNVYISNGDFTPRPFDGTDVGTVVVGQSKQRTFRISNIGNAPLNISQVVLVGVPGAVTGAPSVVAVGATAQFTVNFTPMTPGQKTANIRIVSDDLTSSPFLFATTVFAVDPANILEITDFAVEGPNLSLSFISDPTKTYQIAWSTDLQTWNRPSTLAGLLGDLNEQSYLITGVVDATRPKVFVRVEEE